MAPPEDLATLKGQCDIPDIAANALVATETRPRCDRIEQGALVNLRGPAVIDTDDSDRLVSIRLWVRQGKVNSVTPASACRHRSRSRPYGGGQGAGSG
jgi:zinc transporter